MEHPRQKAPPDHPQRPRFLPGRCQKKTSQTLSERLGHLLHRACSNACASPACARRVFSHMLAILLIPCRATITNQLCATNNAQRDWSATYRDYSLERVEPRLLFREVLLLAHEHLGADQPLVVAIDDTLLRKTGARIHGTGYRRDPLGPKFRINLVRGQRYLQLSLAWPGAAGRAWTLPVAFEHAPPAPKTPKNATKAKKHACKQKQKQQSLTQVAIETIKQLRAMLPATRQLIIAGDGSFTNADILRNLPPGTHYIGRARSDTALHHPPEGAGAPTGRPRTYGAQAPSPEAMLKDEKHPWQEVDAYAAGKMHTFKVKASEAVLWRKSGPALKLRVLVISPLGYRLRKASRMLYRRAAHLICTDPGMSIEAFLQYYLWRWGIEVNFRDEKSLVGVGEAQVRTESSNRTQPACAVAAYSLLWLATLLGAEGWHEQLTRPKWQKPRTQKEASTADLIRVLRLEQWAGQISEQSFSHFVTGPPLDTTDPKPQTSLAHSIFTTA